MRALIFALALVIVALAVSVVQEISSRAGPARREGRVFRVHQLITDARPGELVTYREGGGRRRELSYRVADAPPPGPDSAPVIQIQSYLLDPRLPKSEAIKGGYQHRLTDHFWFPLTNMDVPDALDRVWVWRSITRDTILVGDKSRECWKVTLIDPALPQESETVVVWMSEDVPVYGILQWQRRGETWKLIRSEGASS